MHQIERLKYFSCIYFDCKEEAEIYKILQNIPYYPVMHDFGLNYIVIDYIEGLTLFECLAQGEIITRAHIKEIDFALSLARDRELNPSDIHLRNIFITADGKIKMIDVARFRQRKHCRQWHDLKKAYNQYYRKRFFQRKLLCGN